MNAYKNCLVGYYLGDAYGAPYDLKDQKNPSDITFPEKRSDYASGSWTENGDIVAAIFNTNSPYVARTIKHWKMFGHPDKGDTEGKGLTKIAAKLIDDDEWPISPQSVAEKLAHHGGIALMNLPVVTSIAFINSPNEVLDSYASMFVSDIIAKIAVRFYIWTLRAVLTTAEIDAEEVIRGASENVFKNLEYEDSETFISSAIEYSRDTIGSLKLNREKFSIVGSVKVICYALRIVEIANKLGKMPDIIKVFQLVCSQGGDASSNCALVGSIICGANCGVANVEQEWAKIANRVWITSIIQGLIPQTSH